MKKVESMHEGLLGCEKAKAFSPVIQKYFFLHSLILPEKFAMKRGEGIVTTPRPPLEALFKRLLYTNLTLQYCSLRG